MSRYQEHRKMITLIPIVLKTLPFMTMWTIQIFCAISFLMLDYGHSTRICYDIKSHIFWSYDLYIR